MATVYQIAPGVTLVKDLVFGWTVMSASTTLVLDFASLDDLRVAQSVIPTGLLFTEVQAYMADRIRKLQMQLEVDQSLKARVDEQARAEQERRLEQESAHQRVLQERREVANRMAQSMMAWFTGTGSKFCYEIRSEQGYTYCRVVPLEQGLALLNDRFEVVAQVTDVYAAAEFVLRRWW